MQSESKRELYPHSKSRAILNAVVAVLSLILAVLLLAGETILLLYYAAAAVVFTLATFYVKTRLYISLITKEQSQEMQNGAPQGSRKNLLIAFLMILFMLTFPLLLAGFLPPAAWFIIIVSFTTGIGASEMIIYMRSKKR